MGCILLASKVEEEPRSVHNIILTFAHIYRRRRLRIGDDIAQYSYGAADAEADNCSLLNDQEKENVVNDTVVESEAKAQDKPKAEAEEVKADDDGLMDTDDEKIIGQK